MDEDEAFKAAVESGAFAGMHKPKYIRKEAGVTGFRKETLAEGVELYLGDCLEVLPTLGRFDAVVTDPPYEQLMQDLHSAVRLRRNDGGNERKALTFAGIDTIRPAFIEQVRRLNDGWLLAFCNVEGVWHWREAILAAGLKFKTTCIWVKPDATPKLNGQGPALAYECFTSTWCGRGHARWNAGGKRGTYVHLTNQRDRDGRHPTEKPLPLMREIIADFVPAGGAVLDPFMGSGTTGVAAVKLGRQFTGIEIDPGYFDIARRRIEAALKQPDMFIAPPAPAKQTSLDLTNEAAPSWEPNKSS